mmetsp:Transcript_22853/g.54717  ORF Transcript_22853/g.54717 Transcript_22853/m.54717 type:complete len:328 (-) Transcript_22853:804-1787(-)
MARIACSNPVHGKNASEAFQDAGVGKRGWGRESGKLSAARRKLCPSGIFQALGARRGTRPGWRRPAPPGRGEGGAREGEAGHGRGEGLPRGRHLIKPALDCAALVRVPVSSHDRVLHRLAEDWAEGGTLRGEARAKADRPGRRWEPGAGLPGENGELGQHVEAEVGAVARPRLRARHRDSEERRGARDRPLPGPRVRERPHLLRLRRREAAAAEGLQPAHRREAAADAADESLSRAAARDELKQQDPKAVQVRRRPELAAVQVGGVRVRGAAVGHRPAMGILPGTAAAAPGARRRGRHAASRRDVRLRRCQERRPLARIGPPGGPDT